jgi:pyrroline-5-carboxylate reductase
MKLGFIGAGNMATAILGGVLQSGFLPPEQIAVFDIDPTQSERCAGGPARAYRQVPGGAD